MNTTFKITYSWEKRSTAERFDEDDYVDVTRLFIGLRRFIALYEGHFVLHIAGYDLYFEFSPDLSTVFEELPVILESLTKQTREPVSLDFFEQGTDIRLIMERKGEDIHISFSGGDYMGDRFRDLPAGPLVVPAKEFLSEWLRFLRGILAALADVDPHLRADESYTDYVDHLNKIEREK
jgi:hypothetical protein